MVESILRGLFIVAEVLVLFALCWLVVSFLDAFVASSFVINHEPASWNLLRILFGKG